MISFRFEPEKFASAVAYLAERKPGITRSELCSLLYFADKEHLLSFGRTITGDRYQAMEQGPVPTEGLHALDGTGDERNLEALRRYGRLSGPAFHLEGPADLKTFSKSDIRILDETLDRLGQLGISELADLSRQEPAWVKSRANGPMEFELFFEGRDEAEPIKAILLEEHGARVA